MIEFIDFTRIQSNETDDCNLSDVKQDADTVNKTATSENNIETRPTTPDTAGECLIFLFITYKTESFHVYKQYRGVFLNFLSDV